MNCVSVFEPICFGVLSAAGLGHLLLIVDNNITNDIGMIGNRYILKELSEDPYFKETQLWL